MAVSVFSDAHLSPCLGSSLGGSACAGEQEQNKHASRVQPKEVRRSDVGSGLFQGESIVVRAMKASGVEGRRLTVFNLPVHLDTSGCLIL